MSKTCLRSSTLTFKMLTEVGSLWVVCFLAVFQSIEQSGLNAHWLAHLPLETLGH